MCYFKSLFTEYFLEDIVQILRYVPSPDFGKCKSKDMDEECVVGNNYEENCNLLVSHDYPPYVRTKVANISEEEVDFEIIEVGTFLRVLFLVKDTL